MKFILTSTMVASLMLACTTQAFVVRAPNTPTMTTTTTTANAPRSLSRAWSTTTDSEQQESTLLQDQEEEASRDADSSGSAILRTPLKFAGPYPLLALRFPELSTNAQIAKNMTGVGLDFLLDTAANVNTINAQVAQELRLDVVGQALPGVAASGAMNGGDTYMLGDAQLEGNWGFVVSGEIDNNDDDDGDAGMMNNEEFTFMQNLTASALPIASPASAGLLSLAFFYCFEGGVEFDWGLLPSSSPLATPSSSESDVALEDGLMPQSRLAPSSPSVTFYGEKEDDTLKSKLSKMSRVQIDPIPVTNLPSVTVKLNGVEMPALLDTGSPVTVLNSQAAKQAGLETIDLPNSYNSSGDDKKKKNNSMNPFAAVANKFKEAKAIADAASKGELLTIAGADGKPTNLVKIQKPTEFFVKGTDEDVSFGEGRVYVGDIPGLAALNAVGVDSPPAVVLGMDVLRNRPKMLLRARDNEVYF